MLNALARIQGNDDFQFDLCPKSGSRRATMVASTLSRIGDVRLLKYQWRRALSSKEGVFENEM